MARAAALILMLSAASPALAAPTPGPVTKFVGTAHSYHYLCGLRFQIGLVDTSKLEAASRCIDEAKGAVAPEYRLAGAKLARNGPGTILLKGFYAKWLASMESLMPSPAESARMYELRIDREHSALGESGERLKLEE
jgi:hypothetical protein